MKQTFSERLCEETVVLLRSGQDGAALCHSLTGIVDTLLIALFNEVTTGEVTTPPPPASPPDRRAAVRRRFPAEALPCGLALVAVGGYGRREMAPYSDIDLMLLGRSRDARTAGTAQAVLYRLWDEGLNISHCFRTLDECVEDSMADIATRTTLIESRFLAGSRDLFDDFRKDSYQKILFKKKKEFVSGLLRDIATRHKTYAESIYLLEPNLKEGQGGLRDLHSLAWLARVELHLADLRALESLMSAHDCRQLLRAYDFLLKTRAGLHALSRRKNDVLSFELQEGAASLLGFKDTKRFTAEEILMRLYYKKARTVTDVLSGIMGLCGRRYVNVPMSFSVKRLTDDFSLSKDEIIVKDRALLKNTDKIFEAFALASSTGKRLSAHLKESIRSRSLFINKRTRASRTAAEHFMGILRGGRVYQTIREMHETGVLDRFIPEFGALRHLVISEPYHRYTVDEHSLIALKNIEAIREGRQARFFYLGDILKKVKQEVLFLAVLLHDIGKGISKQHEEAGYSMLKGVMERFAIDRVDRKIISFLVKNHIVLSKLALTRDIDAPETIAQLAEVVEYEENLDALYLMTYADMSAVNPRFWTEWKAYLLHALYTRTKEHLKGAKGQLTVADGRLKEFAATMPGRYLIANTNDIINADYALSERARGEGIAATITEREDGTAEVALATRDMPGLFANIAGVLSSKGLNIRSARLYTGATGLVIDKITVSNWSEVWWTGMEEQIRNDLRAAILPAARGAAVTACATAPQERTAGLFSSNAPGEGFFRFETFIEIDNEASADHTILELFLPDRFGLLRDIALRLCEHRIDIIAAVINTEEGIAQDVFYLQHRGGKLPAEKILDLLPALQLPAGGGRRELNLPAAR